MNLTSSKTLNALGFLGIISTITLAVATHPEVKFPDKTFAFNDRFFNNIRALVKKQLQENFEIKNLNLGSEKQNLNNKVLNIDGKKIPISSAYVPTPVLVGNWPARSHSYGQITAVSINPQGNPVIFHRADRYWDATSFNGSNMYFLKEYGPIQDKTIFVLDSGTGSIKSSWGEDLFYMPHGMTIDIHDNYWITDVALHQAFKKSLSTRDVLQYEIHSRTKVSAHCKFQTLAVRQQSNRLLEGQYIEMGLRSLLYPCIQKEVRFKGKEKFKPYERQPLLTIGKRFRPGSSIKHLCQPTSIAVSTTGEFFVADGYCNQRILKFNAAGRLLRVIPQPPEFLSLQVPHSITLLEHLDLLCIADRENMRVVCPKAGLKSSQSEGYPAATIQEPDLGRVFSVAAFGDIVYAVNGPTSMLPVRGFTIDPRSETIIGHWGEFKNPHSIAVSVNGSALYVTEIGINQRTNRILKYVLV